MKKINTSTALFLLATIVYFLSEAIAAMAWNNPHYSYSYNYISDLGIPIITVFDGRSINSPLHAVMNVGLISYAVLSMLAFCGISKVKIIPDKWRNMGIILALLHGIGVVMVGVFPGYDWWGITFHGIGAALAIFGGNLAIISLGLHLQFNRRKWFANLSLWLGIIGITGLFVCIGIHQDFKGLFERISIYSILLWEIIFAIVLIIHQHRNSILANN